MTDSDSGERRERAAKTSLAELLRSAGPRPAPSSQAEERVKDAVYQAYLGQLQRRRRQRWWLGVAASILALVVASLIFQQQQPPPIVVAHVARTLGTPGSVGDAAAAPMQSVRTRDAVSVPPGSRVLLTLTNGMGLRVNESSRLVFESPASIRLNAGAVYVETPRDAAQVPELSIETDYGAVQHVGTRFEVRVGEDALRVRVREGIAVFRGAAGTNTTIKSGEQLDYRSGAIVVGPGPGSASEAWAWVEAIRPDYRIEGRSLAEALEWLAHEAGVRLEFTDEVSRTRAASTILHGDVGSLTPRQAIRAVLAGSDLPYVIEGTRLVVGPR